MTLHQHRLPMRMSDLDHLGHVNNVVYLEYADEARAALVAAGHLDPALRPASTGVDFLRPMLVSSTPVTVETEVAGDRIDQIVSQDVAGERVEFARVSTRLARETDLGGARLTGSARPLHARRRDLGEDGVVSPVQAFLCLQEARVLSMAEAREGGVLGEVAVAHSEVEYGRPAQWRPEPWQVVVEVGHVGTRSFTLLCEWSDGGALVCRSSTVLVAFDIPTQRSRPLSEAERDHLTARLVRHG